MEATVKIRELQKVDLSQAVEALGKAFATNPNTLAIFGGKPAARQMQIAFAGVFKYLPGKVFVAELDSRVVGAMRIVKWPDCQAQSLKMMPSMLRVVGGLGPLSRVMRMRSTWEKHDPKKPHWHLDPLGVTPELQGKGIGGQMMQFYCTLIDAEKMEAYHETDRLENVSFYQKFGFEVVGEEMGIIYLTTG